MRTANMRTLATILMMFFLKSVSAVPSISVFVSFSMPKPLLIETLKESSRLKIPAFLNGLYHNSIDDTAIKIMALSEEIPDLNLAIDPTAFERFGIHQVPALVVNDEKNFDVIYGHLPLKDGLMRIANRGECGLSVRDVRRITGD